MNADRAVTREDRRVVAEALQNGEKLFAMACDQGGAILAQGFIEWTGSILEAKRDGTATELRIDYKGDQLRAPLINPVPLKQGQDTQIEFGRNWQ